MGTVYQARDMNFPNVTRLVALKEVAYPTWDSRQREAMTSSFEQQAALLASLEHPAIPPIFDEFIAREGCYLVMGYVNGYDLDSLIKRTPNFLPVEMIVKWAMQLCDVLHYLHTHKPEAVIFHDLMPSNIMINNHGNVQLIDFGIAKPFRLPDYVAPLANVGYAPPEQVLGKKLSPSIDIYALGATLHHALTRRDPRLEPPHSFADRSIRDINPQVSRELERIVIRALHKRPRDRYANALAMKAALENVVSLK